MEKISAYIINESKGPESDPVILDSNKAICRFRVDYLQEADMFNRNRRNYPWNLLYTACTQEPVLQERLSTGTLYCEVGHPDDKSIPRQIQIKRVNASCIIKSLSFNKPYIGGILETCATQMGRDLMGLITINKCKVAFSMRGVGKVVERNGQFLVVPPLRVVTWDEVVQPSVPKAYLSEVLTESVEAPSQGIASNGKPLNEKLIAISEEDLKQYLVSSDKTIKSFCEQMEINPKSDKITINEDGTLSFYQDGRTIHMNPTVFARREIKNYLRGL